MLTNSDHARAVRFCELVEHPGGHDGGEFAQYHEYGATSDGSLFYSTDFPDCSCDAFVDEPESDFIEAKTREEALVVLKDRLFQHERQVATLKEVIAAFEKDAEFTVYFADESIDTDDWGGDDDEDEDYDDGSEPGRAP